MLIDQLSNNHYKLFEVRYNKNIWKNKRNLFRINYKRMMVNCCWCQAHRRSIEQISDLPLEKWTVRCLMIRSFRLLWTQSKWSSRDKRSNGKPNRRCWPWSNRQWEGWKYSSLIPPSSTIIKTKVVILVSRVEEEKRN